MVKSIKSYLGIIHRLGLLAKVVLLASLRLVAGFSDASLMVQLLAQKAGLDGKVKVFVLYVEPITDMIDRSLKADAH